MATAAFDVPRLGEWSARLDQLTDRLIAGADRAQAAELKTVFRETIELLRNRAANVVDETGAVFDEYLACRPRAVVLGRPPDRPDSEASSQWLEAPQAGVRGLWVGLCDRLSKYERNAAELRGRGWFSSSRLRRAAREVVEEYDSLCERMRDLIRYLVIAAPELDLEIPEHLAGSVLTVRVTPLAYLRTMWNILWSAIRHPLSTPTIDLSTGRVMYRT